MISGKEHHIAPDLLTNGRAPILLSPPSMESVSGIYNSIADGTRFAGKMGLMGGRMLRRYYKSATQGVCLVCNNLQPHGHEGMLDQYLPRSHGRRLESKESTKANLTLTDISTKDLLQSRERDESTGVPKRDCRYCRLLCDIFDAFFVDEYMSWITETLNGMPISVGLMIQEGSPLIINCWGFTYDKYTWNPRVDLEMFYDSSPGANLDLTGAPCLGAAGTRAESVGSQKCRRFILESVCQCRHEHKLCATQATGFVPTRLVHLGNSNDELKICESSAQGKQLPWVALSHCWGGKQPHKLLRENMLSLKQHIDFTVLPATFCNAIEVTRELGLRYLWIDSLCIVQNDKADWEVEAASMGMVYGQATVVICAASSPNPETPFISRRDEEWLPKSFQVESAPGVTIPVKVRQRSLLAAPLEQGSYEPPFTGAWALQRRAGPLYERGWCFQETFLALRTLHFSPGGLVFECKTHRRCEDQLPPFPSTVPGTLGEVSEAESWHMIVRAYTQRQLTFAKDKLPAIGGAASNMPQAKRSEYTSGLWRQNLLPDLMWQVMPGGCHLALSFPGNEYVAPSWSWASVDRGVLWNPLNSFQPLAEVVSAESHVVGANQYGQVTGGRICLRGRIKSCYVSTLNNKNEQWAYYVKSGRQSKKQHFRSDGLLMSETNAAEQEAFVRRAREGEWNSEVLATASFFCIARTPWTNYNYVGLILSQSPSTSGCMERVGSMTNVPGDWYKDGAPTTVTIV